MSTWEVDTGLGSRQARKAQDTGAGELESGERCDLGARLAWLAVSSVQIGCDTPGPRGRLGQIQTQSTGHGPCSSSSPVRAAGSQEVLIGVELHHVDRPRVARELGHHLASSQIPELGQGGREVRTSLALSLWMTLSSSPRSLSTNRLPLWTVLGRASPMRREIRTQPGCNRQTPVPSPGPMPGWELPSPCGHLRPMPTTSHQG